MGFCLQEIIPSAMYRCICHASRNYEVSGNIYSYIGLSTDYVARKLTTYPNKRHVNKLHTEYFKITPKTLYERCLARDSVLANVFITDVPIREVEDCSCMESCDSRSYGLDLSYATLAASSVNTFLNSDIHELRSKYHRALELKYVSFRWGPYY